jgi:hypothetical protein
MKSFHEIIKGDTFDYKDVYYVDTKVTKMCWECERGHTAGYMVMDTTKTRRIFICEECYEKLNN